MHVDIREDFFLSRCSVVSHHTVIVLVNEDQKRQ